MTEKATLPRETRPGAVGQSHAGRFWGLLVLCLLGSAMVLPLIYVVCNAFKPLDELYVFPPRFFVRNPTVGNFRALANLLGESQVPMIRYIFNTIFVTAVATGLHLLIASLAAFTLEKRKFPGRQLLFQDGGAGADVLHGHHLDPELHHHGAPRLDRYLLVADCAGDCLPIGLFLMKQFMSTVPDSLLEAARIDGASEWQSFLRIAMPCVKPAWLTLIIFSFQNLWPITGGTYIFSEELKPLNYALNQILSGGIVRAGAGAAGTLFMVIPPVVVFIVSQKNILYTMASSGIKE